MSDLIDLLFRQAFDNPLLNQANDQARFDTEPGPMVMTTDSFVISPLFFPGGNIGSLAVHGTVNDLAMGGAEPLYLTAGFILEEGLPLADLARIVEAMADAASTAGVSIVTGDTKVVERGKGDGVFINTAGLGRVYPGVRVSAELARPGDQIIVSGSVGDHGVAVMSQRRGLQFETALESDSASLNRLVARMVEVAGPELRVLRDPTRGGVGTTLNEIAESSQAGIILQESWLPVRDAVAGACELLGFDPLYVANEGKCIAIVGPERAEAALAAMRAHPLGQDAAIIGEVVADHPGRVYLRSQIGGMRIVDMLSGEQLPRIC